MAQISFEQASEVMNSFNGDGNSVGFFTLRDDGDEAVVRFMHDNTSTFDIVACHSINIDGKYRKVNCIRDPREPLDRCPFCNNGIKIENRFFIHLIQYDKDQNGNIVASAKIWERSLAYAKQLANLIQEYGPLSDCIFKVRRDGAKGSMDTKYQIMFASPQVYRPDLYPKRPELFENYKTIGGIVMDRTFEEMSEFLSTGKFPERKQQQSTPTQPISQNYNTPPQQYTPVPNFPDPLPNYSNTQSFSTPQQYQNPLSGQAPWEAATPINRPIRTY